MFVKTLKSTEALKYMKEGRIVGDNFNRREVRFYKIDDGTFQYSDDLKEWKMSRLGNEEQFLNGSRNFSFRLVKKEQ